MHEYVRQVIGGVLLSFAACTSTSNSTLDGIVNGSDKASLSTYWSSDSSKGCIVGHGPKGEQCAGPIYFALASDGTATWSTYSYGYYGTSTWTRLGDDALLLNGLPFQPTSLNLSTIVGAVSEGTFNATTATYGDMTFTLGGGSPPGWSP